MKATTTRSHTHSALWENNGLYLSLSGHPYKPATVSAQMETLVEFLTYSEIFNLF